MKSKGTVSFRYLALIVFLAMIGVSCSYYSWGGRKPVAFANIHTIHVATAKNNSYYPRLEATVTSAIVEELNGSGMYVAGMAGGSDAVLKGTIVSVTQTQIRSQSYNTYRSQQTMMNLTFAYEIVNTQTGETIANGRINARSDYYNQPNQSSAKSDALSFAARDLANKLVSRLCN